MDTEIKILIAVITAVSVISGVLISQFVSLLRDMLDKRHSRNVLLRDKYEELALLITESPEWFCQISNAESLLELSGNPPSHARKAMVISHIYFPLICKPCEVFLNSSVNFQQVVIDNYGFKEGVTAGAQAVIKDRKVFEAAAGHLSNCRNSLENEIIKHAKKYAKA